MKNKFLYWFFCINTGLLFLSHEYVLMSEDYKVEKGDILYLHLFVAEGFNVILERPLQKSETRNFTIETNEGITNLLTNGKDEQLPVFETTVDFDGPALISMERDYSRISLPPDEFAQYLLTDHLDNILFDEEKTSALQREKYSRYLKALILTGKNNSGDLYKKELGYALEIILLDDPYSLKVGDSINAKILFRGMPLIGKTITARSRNGDDNAMVSTAKTDGSGSVKFSINKEGDWFIHLTHMIPCADKSDCDWESFWASYSFGIDGE